MIIGRQSSVWCVKNRWFASWQINVKLTCNMISVNINCILARINKTLKVFILETFIPSHKNPSNEVSQCSTVITIIIIMAFASTDQTDPLDHPFFLFQSSFSFSSIDWIICIVTSDNQYNTHVEQASKEWWIGWSIPGNTQLEFN